VSSQTKRAKVADRNTARAVLKRVHRVADGAAADGAGAADGVGVTDRAGAAASGGGADSDWAADGAAAAGRAGAADSGGGADSAGAADGAVSDAEQGSLIRVFEGKQMSYRFTVCDCCLGKTMKAGSQRDDPLTDYSDANGLVAKGRLCKKRCRKNKVACVRVCVCVCVCVCVYVCVCVCVHMCVCVCVS
jgi:hypothetical protein